MNHSRRCLPLLLQCWLLLLWCAVAKAVDAPPSHHESRDETLAIDTAVSRGVAFLVAQQRDDGHLRSRGLYAGHAAVTALAGLALLADDNTPSRGPHAETTRRLVAALVRDARPSGFIGDETTSLQAMYAHGYAVTFLAEVCGMADDGDEKKETALRDVVRRGVAIIVKTQNPQGGWRYAPRVVEDADISVTATQIIALRSAKNAGFFVPPNVVAAATDYIARLQNDDGGFRYRLTEKESGFARSAVAVVALQAAGDYESDRVKRALGYIASKALPRLEAATPRLEYETYGLFYTGIAIHCGDCVAASVSLTWSDWYSRTARDLVARQQADGSWESSTSSEVETAMILVLLRLPHYRIASFQK